MTPLNSNTYLSGAEFLTPEKRRFKGPPVLMSDEQEWPILPTLLALDKQDIEARIQAAHSKLQ